LCGIVGIVSSSEAAPVLLKALKKLEYRGYDSAGIATAVNSHLEIRKGIGKLDEVEKNCLLSLMPGVSGIGHVRWATHGRVTAENAHPHFDCTHSVAIVHNGIIENFQELKAELVDRHTFISDTDTEIIVHLIEDELYGSPKIQRQTLAPDLLLTVNSDSSSSPTLDAQLKIKNSKLLPNSGIPPESEYRENLFTASPRHADNSPSLERAVFNVTKKLKGSFALLVISSSDPDKIVAARQDSPLVIGIGKNANFLASDILCFLDQTDQAIYVEDGETVIITAQEVRILDQNFQPVHREPILLDPVSEQSTRGGYAHFMLEEIFKQPQSIRRSLEQDTQMIMDIAMDMLRARQVVMTGCGTSRHAALVGRYVFSKLAGIFSEVVIGSEFQYFSNSVDKNTVVIAVSQSGETADIIQGVKMAKGNGAKVFSLINTHHSTLSRLSDRVVSLQCGPEIAVAATKTFISELTVFYLLAFAMQNRQAEGIKKILPMADLIQASLDTNNTGLAQLANFLKDQHNFYFLGRGINYAIAGEGALKLKEVAYVHAEGLSSGELKHGTLALIESGTPVIALCPSDYTHAESLSNIMETKARGAFVIGVSDKPNPAFDEWIHIPAVEEIFYPLVSIIPLQLFAYYSALARGIDPDKPRNLAKSVTVK